MNLLLFLAAAFIASMSGYSDGISNYPEKQHGCQLSAHQAHPCSDAGFVFEEENEKNEPQQQVLPSFELLNASGVCVSTSLASVHLSCTGVLRLSSPIYLSLHNFRI